MRLPVLKTRNKYKRRIIAFGGLNLTQNFSEGEMRDLNGITHKEFPTLTQPSKTESFLDCSHPTAAHYGSEICVAADDGLYYGGQNVGTLTSGDKMIAEIGNKIVVFPDKVYYDTTEKKLLSMEGTRHLSETEIIYTQNSMKLKNSVYETVSTTESLVFEPEYKLIKCTSAAAENGKVKLTGLTVVEAKDLVAEDFFIETNVEGYYRKAFSVVKNEDGKIKVTGELVKTRDITKEIFSQFREGDVVEITGSILQGDSKEVRIVEIIENGFTVADGTFEVGTKTEDIVLKRKIPDFSGICVYENRLWGCEGKTIYASKLGDPLNFYIYQGVSTDSFSVESNSAGDFTAVATYGNICLFFKEDKCYKLYGNRPANFSLTESFGAGITKENAKSIVCINGQLMYKGNGGVYAFSGGLPQLVSDKLGEALPQNCVGGGAGCFYYMSGDYNGQREEYVFNIKNGLWSKSGIKDVIGYFTCGEDLYRLKENGVEKVTDAPDYEKEWYAEFCPFNEDYHKEKSYSRLYITAQLYENSWIKAEVSRDGEKWQTVAVKYGKKKEHINIPCVVKNCHELTLRLSGKGKSIIESIVREFSVN